MSRRAIPAFAVVFLALIGFAGYETRVASQQGEQLAELRQRATQLAADTAKLRRERDTTAQELTEAERQLAALPASSEPNVTPERRTEMKAWLGRVKKLRDLFDERPDQRIPEMQLLTDQDWLRVAKNLQLESEEDQRSAFAAVRDVASARFTPQLSAALRKFVASSPGDKATIGALASFFETTVDPRLLERYELSQMQEPRAQWRVQTKLPIDPDYDSRHHVSVQAGGRGWSGGSENAPWAWAPGLRDQMGRAYQAYAAANKGTAARGLTDVLPFFDPPLAPSVAEKLVKAEERQMKKFFGP